VFISTISQTTGQAIQTAFLILMPQILLSGMIFPLDAMAASVRWIGYLLPLTYFTFISRGIMLRGASMGSLWYAYVILAVMAVVVFSAATLRFRRDLAPGGGKSDDAAEGADAAPTAAPARTIASPEGRQ
jgi:ABC-2 type transport system permease protein